MQFTVGSSINIGDSCGSGGGSIGGCVGVHEDGGR